MKNKILFIAICFFHTLAVLGQAGLEQYYYVQKGQPLMLMPILHVQNSRNWYAEGRFNYEELNSGSLYIGKKFSIEKKELFLSATPLVGGIAGSIKGIAPGLNVSAEYNRFSFDSQTQYIVAWKDKGKNCFFNWSEIVYEPVKWLFLGGSLQTTCITGNRTRKIEGGVVMGINYRNWSFPIYGFNLSSSERYFILGVNFGLGLEKANTSHVKHRNP
jgi:hypothetical protein